MGKFKSWKHRNLFMSICTSTCLVGASAGLIFGVSAGTFKVNYFDLNNSKARVDSANGAFNYYSQDIKSEWNMDDKWNPNQQTVDSKWWNDIHNNAPRLITDELAEKMEMDKPFAGDEQLSNDAKTARYNYAAMVIDGSTHSTMDRSFNQGLYNGLVNFVQNKKIASTALAPETENDPTTKNCGKSFKPGGDNTTEFINIYNTVAKQYKVVNLAGFNHDTPLHALGKYNEKTKRVEFENHDIDGTGFLLIDGNVNNNQNVSSVLFRADQPGFLTAISTCMYFLNNLDTYHKEYRDLEVGVYGGTSIPTVTIYMGGFQRGVEFFNNFILWSEMLDNDMRNFIQLPGKKISEVDADVQKLYQHSKHKAEIDQLKTSSPTKDQTTSLLKKLYDEFSIKMIKLGAGGTHFSGTFNAGDAIGITKQYLNRGASAIVAVAGPQSLDTAQEIQNQSSNCIVIGVDTAMEEGDFQRPFKNGCEDKTIAPDGTKPAQKGNIIKFSAIKDICSVTQKFTDLCAKNKNFDVPMGDHPGYPDPERAVCGIGYKTCGNIENGLISISWDGWYPFVQALSHMRNCVVDKRSIPFTDAWTLVANSWLVKHKEELLETSFKEKVNNINNLMTYDRNKDGGWIDRNYDKIMSILGDFLNNVEVEFPANMTVKRAEKTVEGKTVVYYVEETENRKLPILQWLKLNMYFTV